jgi:hypothetical protein
MFKKALLVLSLAAFSSLAHADASLKDNMKQIGTLFKQIGATLRDVSQDPQNAQNAQQMNQLFQVVYGQAEDGVKDVPASQKEAALADFQNLIQQEIDLSAQLQSAFEASNNQQASAIYQQMNKIKSDGHDKYNP